MPPPERLRHRRSSRGPADVEIRKEEEARRERERRRCVGVAVVGIRGGRRKGGMGVAALRGRREECVAVDWGRCVQRDDETRI